MDSPTKVAVAGGTGFLGRAVVEAITAAGMSVRVLSRHADPTEDTAQREHRALDVGARPLPADALAGCDAVVNLVGIKAPRGDNDFQRAHVTAVDHLLDAATAAGIERFVHISVAQADDAVGDYARTKREGERRVEKSDRKATVLRPGLIVGPGDDALRNLIRMVRLAPLCPVPAGATGPLPAIDVRDVALAVVATLQDPQTVGARIDLVGPEVLDLRALVRKVASALELPTATPPLPDALARVGAVVMESTLPDPLLSRSQLAMLTRGLPGDPDEARERLGLEPRPLTSERIVEVAEHVPDLLPSLRLCPSAEHRRWLTGLADKLTAWPLLLVAALVAMLALPGLLPGVFVRMAAINGALLLLVLGLGRHALPELLRPRPTNFGLSVRLGIATAVVLYGAADLFMAGLRVALPDLAQQVQTVYAWSDAEPFGLRLALLPLIVAGEDVVWRGAVTFPLAARLGPVVGCVAAGTVFALAHVTTGPPLLLIAALAMGTIWSALAIRTRSLVPVVVSHLLWDLLVMFVRPL